MRKLLYIAFIISTGSLTQAQDTQNSAKSVQLKVKPTAMHIINVVQPTLLNRKATTLAMIFLMKSSRVKHALSFKVKTKNPKLI